MEETDQNIQGNAFIVELTNPDLPLFCPDNELPVAFAHPRVFLNISMDGTCRCPYCNTLYIVRSITV